MPASATPAASTTAIAARGHRLDRRPGRGRRGPGGRRRQVLARRHEAQREGAADQPGHLRADRLRVAASRRCGGPSSAAPWSGSPSRRPRASRPPRPRAADRRPCSPPSRAEQEVQHVAVLHPVGLALGAEPAGLAGAGLAAERDIVVVGDGLGADEALLEVAVDDAGRLRRAGALGDRPGARLLRAGGEVGGEPEQAVALVDQPVEPGLVQAQRPRGTPPARRRRAGRPPPRSPPRSPRRRSPRRRPSPPPPRRRRCRWRRSPPRRCRRRGPASRSGAAAAARCGRPPRPPAPSAPGGPPPAPPSPPRAAAPGRPPPCRRP